MSEAASIVFQCRACLALGVATRLVVSHGKRTAGLVCSTCAAISWLPLVTDSLAASAATTTALDRTKRGERHSEDARQGMPSDDRTRPRDDAAIGVLHDQRGGHDDLDEDSLADADDQRDGRQAPNEEDDRVREREHTGATTKDFSEASSFPADLRERLFERWAALGAGGEQQASLGARLERMAVRGWHDESEHKAVVAAAAAASQLAFVGARYRAVLDVAPRDPHARKAQQEILSLAVAMMKRPEGTWPDGETAPRKASLQALLVVVLFLAVAVAVGGGVGNLIIDAAKQFTRLDMP
jgi:hypothetical protein